ncbi:hypothetical protein [Nocardia higoensis]|uniref:hypothetical protein n=1 Tax=Nocardia higoensis TaxID=228599 RepID=UPI0012F64AEA|nr:hypothetical protein [Nocardia higoensis]
MTIPVFVAPVAVGRLITRFPALTIGKVVYLSLAALTLGNAGVLALAQDRSVLWIIVPMVLLGLGFGLPIGLVDGHALAVVPAERGGTAAGRFGHPDVYRSAVTTTVGVLIALLMALILLIVAVRGNERARQYLRPRCPACRCEPGRPSIRLGRYRPGGPQPCFSISIWVKNS